MTKISIHLTFTVHKNYTKVTKTRQDFTDTLPRAGYIELKNTVYRKETNLLLLLLLLLLDFDECKGKTHYCHPFATCFNERGSYSCKCKHGYFGNGFHCRNLKSCSEIRKYGSSVSRNYMIDPDGFGGLAPFTVYRDMTDNTGVGVTVISHDSETRTLVKGYEAIGGYSRDIHYTGASLSQMASLTRVSSHCEQFIKYECHVSVLLYNNDPRGWWVSRDSTKMRYWGGASGNGKCACRMTKSCADPSDGCNCDKNDYVWREDSGLLTDKTKLPVKQLRFGDTGDKDEKGFFTLGKFKCYGTV